MPRVAIPGVGTVAFPDSMPADAIAAEAGRLHDAAAAKAAPPAPMSAMRTAGTIMEGLHPTGMALSRLGVESLPTAGSLAGELGGVALAGAAGLPSGPGALATGYAGGVAGGALGSAGGRVARNAVAMSPAGEFLGVQRPSSIGEGVGGAAAQGAGASALGLPLGAAASRVAGVLTGKTLARAGAQAEHAARASNLRVDATSVLKGVEKLEKEAAMMGEREMRAVQKLKDSMLKPRLRGGKLTLSGQDLHELRQVADKVAENIHKARQANQVIGPKQEMRGRFWEAVGNDARAILKEHVPGYREAMKASQKAIGSMKRVPRVSEGPIRGTLTNPFGAPELATRAVMGRPAMEAYGGILDSPVTQSLLRQGPRGLMLLQQLMGAEPDTTGGMP